MCVSLFCEGTAEQKKHHDWISELLFFHSFTPKWLSQGFTWETTACNDVFGFNNIMNRHLMQSWHPENCGNCRAEGSSDEVMMQNDALRPLKFQLIFCVSGAYSQTIMEYNESNYHKPNDTTNPRLPAPLWVWELGQLLLLVHKPTLQAASINRTCKMVIQELSFLFPGGFIPVTLGVSWMNPSIFNSGFTCPKWPLCSQLSSCILPDCLPCCCSTY